MFIWVCGGEGYSDAFIKFIGLADCFVYKIFIWSVCVWGGGGGVRKMNIFGSMITKLDIFWR